MEMISVTQGRSVKREHGGQFFKKIRELQQQGYTENFGSGYDHLTCGEGNIKVYPHDIVLEDIYRFEGVNEKEDARILYAISYPDLNIKGLYVEPTPHGVHQR